MNYRNFCVFIDPFVIAESSWFQKLSSYISTIDFIILLLFDHIHLLIPIRMVDIVGIPNRLTTAAFKHSDVNKA